MNFVDIAIIVILVLGALNGLRAGFIVAVASIIGSIVAFAVARVEYKPVRAFLASFAPHSQWLTVIAYLVVFLVVLAIIMTLARFLRRLAHIFFLGMYDRLGGAILGLIQAAIVLELLLYLGLRVPNGTLHHGMTHSHLAHTFLHLVPALNRFFPHIKKL
jgi:membrane protein required for colicin V production